LPDPRHLILVDDAGGIDESKVGVPHLGPGYRRVVALVRIVRPAGAVVHDDVQGVRVIHWNADLIAVARALADTQDVREDQWMADGPVVRVLRVALDEP